MRKIDQAGIDFIKEREGLRLTAYDDGGGVWTIGWGSTKGVKQGMKITRETAEKMLKDDLVVFEGGVDALVKVPLTQNQFNVLVSFSFNVGMAAFRKSTLLKVLNQGHYDRVPNELSKWVKDNGKVVQGLVKRRALEAALFMSDIDEPTGKVTPQRATPTVVNKENVTWGAGIAAAVATPIADLGNAGEPIQYAIAGIMVAAFAIGAWFFIRRRGA